VGEREQYFLGYRRAEQERLQRQAEELAPEATWLLDQIGVRAGARVVEIGCGPHGCLDLLSARVGPSGRVVGIERSEDAVALARAMIATRGLGNVEVRHGDARSTGLAEGSFDLALARLVLVNVPEPEQIVAEAVELTRPNGAVAFHEVDWSAMFFDPPLPAWDTLFDLYIRFTSTNGIDLFIGRKVPRLLRAAGLIDVTTRPIVHIHPPGNGRRRLLLDFADNLRDRIVAQNLISDAAYADLKEALRQHIENPETLVVHGVYFQVWGRKPDRKKGV
jgi:SAM-dependent methyltransferase